MMDSKPHSERLAHAREAIGMDENVSGAAQTFCDEARGIFDGLVEQFEVYREFYAAWWEVEKGVIDFDLHSEAVTRLSEAHAAVIRLDPNPSSSPGK